MTSDVETRGTLPRPKPLPMTVTGGDRPLPMTVRGGVREEGGGGGGLPRPKPLPMTVRGGDREELYHDPSPFPGPSEVETGKSFATTQALFQDRQRRRQGRALPRPKPLPMTVRGGDREELYHDPSPCP